MPFRMNSPFYKKDKIRRRDVKKMTEAEATGVTHKRILEIEKTPDWQKSFKLKRERKKLYRLKEKYGD